ncbi:MAG: AAA family ATPase [Herbinix sp.]|nr:AAA family ATPase [Herbinix sp.]
MKIVLNKEMEYAMKEVQYWFKKGKKPVFEIAGAAGTGKTTLVKYIIEELGLDDDEVLFMAYVGKAALQLIRKGTRAKTIHSVIYEPYDAPVLDANGNKIKDEATGRELTRVIFKKRKNIDPNIRLMVIDEGSMVGEDIAKDLLSFNIPIIVLGDLNQLPPVLQKPYFLKKPDVILTQIYRQKEDDPIIYLSQKAIVGEPLKIGRYGEKCFIVPKNLLSDTNYMWADVNICAKNITRDMLNSHIRNRILGKIGKEPTIDDKIICRKNNWNKSISNGIFLINGLVGNITDMNIETFNHRDLVIDFKPEFIQNEQFEDVIIDYNYLVASFEKKKELMDKNRKYDVIDKFEYAYAISAHLSQGSQYRNVLVYNEFMGGRDFYNKWLYTAITRAEEGLIIAV